MLDGDEARTFEPLWRRALAGSGWSLDDIRWDGRVRNVPAVVVLLSDTAQRHAAVALQPLRLIPKSFARTGRFAVSYLSQWHEQEFVFDPALMSRVVDMLRRWESSAATAAR